MYYTQFNTPLCEIILAGDEEGLKHLHLNTGRGKRQFGIRPEWTRNDLFFKEAVGQINEYIAGRRTSFDLKLAPEGTVFQKAVWSRLQQIPFGETRTYGQLAAETGNPNAARAVGMANSRNPIPLIIPCHRVIGSSGKLTGFAHGLEIKQRRLALESASR